MKFLIVLSLMIVAVFAAEKYNSKYDNFDVENLVTNDRLLKAYINCFLDKGRCTAEGTDFKTRIMSHCWTRISSTIGGQLTYLYHVAQMETLPEAIETTCAKCTEKQKGNIRKVIKTIQIKHPKEWEELVKKNDPTGRHRTNFDKFIHGSS